MHSKKTLFTLYVIGSFVFLSSMFLQQVQALTMSWNTFMGSTLHDYISSIAIDGEGNLYVTGKSYGTWGSPINPYSANYDAFLARLDSSGNLAWNTFIGSTDSDTGESIAVDGAGNLYVTGTSSATWGSPVNSHAGGVDAFLAKFDSNGNLVWNTFIGSTAVDTGRGVVIDGSGNVYMDGTSSATWGSPVNSHAGGGDAYVAKLDGSGNLVWNTFMGSAADDSSSSIAIDGAGNLYITGNSSATWGSPINQYAGEVAAYVAKLDSSGNLAWNTFMATSRNYAFDNVNGNGIAVDSSGNVYVTGKSNAPMGSPINPYSAGWDAFAVKLTSNGTLVWNTFMGSAAEDSSSGIALDESGNLYVTGSSAAPWGGPTNPHVGQTDAFAAKLDGSGNLFWNTFMGSTNYDYGSGIAIDGSDNLYVSGFSYATWGSPINSYTAGWDTFVVKLNDGTAPVTTTTTSIPSDADFDGIDDAVDNCPDNYNPQQLDADADGIGDVCDPTPGCGGCGWPLCEGGTDTDADLWDDAVDNCPSTYNPNHGDADTDGIGDCCDPEPGCGGCGQPACDSMCSQ